MPDQRILQVAFALPNSGSPSGTTFDPFDVRSGNVILDQNFNMAVHIKKNSLAYQNTAEITVTNLPQHLRQQLLTNFNQYRYAQFNEQGLKQPMAQVWIKAGYIRSNSGATSSGYGSFSPQNTAAIIYQGDVTMTDLISGPPNITVRIVAQTHFKDMATYLQAIPSNSTTFKQFVIWAGNMMGFDNNHIFCSTSHDSDLIQNPARSIVAVGQLLRFIQDYYHPDIAAYVDDEYMYVRDMNKIINPGEISQIDNFIGVPSWTAWGVRGTVLLDPSIRVGGGAQFTSILNPSMNGLFVVMSLEYHLTSRETPFYVSVEGLPPIGSENAVVQGQLVTQFPNTI